MSKLYIDSVSKNQALSLRSQWLGELLRVARTRAGHTLQDAGDYLRLEGASISRFERGTHPIRPSYVRDLISFYGVSDELERERLLRLNDDAWRKDWWEGDTSDLDMGFVDYTWLEARAARIKQYDPILINGLLQTLDYSHAVCAAFCDASTVDRMVELRMTRQRIFDRQKPTELSIVLEEAPLCRAIGGANVHRDQLTHLLDMARKAFTDIRVITTEVGLHRGWHGPFTVFELPDPFPDVVYLEGLVGRQFLEDQAKVTAYKRAYDELHAAALTPKKSVAHIDSVLEGIA